MSLFDHRAWIISRLFKAYILEHKKIIVVYNKDYKLTQASGASVCQKCDKKRTKDIL